MNLAVLAIGRQKINYAAKVRNGLCPAHPECGSSQAQELESPPVPFANLPERKRTVGLDERKDANCRSVHEKMHCDSLIVYLPSNLSLRWLYSRSEITPLS